jgi:hypothetical protein
MKKPKEVTVSIDDQFFTIELSVNDDDLIEAFFGMLKRYVKEKSPIKLTQAMVYPESFSNETKIVTKTITQNKEIDKLRRELMSATATLMRRRNGRV